MYNEPLNDSEKQVQRDTPDVDDGRMELVADWLEKIEDAESVWATKFERMRSDAKYAAGKSPTTDHDVQLMLNHINRRVASLYAKNPKVRVSRKQKIYASLWDGTKEQIEAAKQSLIPPEQMAMQALMQSQATGQLTPPAPPPMDPAHAQMIMQEYSLIEQEKKKWSKISKTLELIIGYSINEQIPGFKPQAKQAVRRAITTSVAYCKLGYQRLMKQMPDVDAKIKDASDKLAQIQMLADDLADGEIEESSKEAEALKIHLEELQEQKEIILREGLVFSFPNAWSIIVDPNCTQLKGFIGADWVAQKYLFTTNQVQKIYGIDVKNSYKAFDQSGCKGDKRTKSKSLCAVYEVYDLVSQECFTLVAGYPDFAKEPCEPNIILEQFHPFFPLTFNDVEDPETVFCQSDVELIRGLVEEYNRKRNAKRVHRLASTPAYLASSNAVDDNDLKKLQDHEPMEIIKTKLKAGEVEKSIVAKPTIPIDPALYDVEDSFIDIQRSVGKQSADFGAGSQPVISATESSIAAQGLATFEKSNIDDIDMWLTDIMRNAGQVLLLEMGEETVKEIAGPGAIWPTLSREEVAKEVYIEIKAGSSGLPNQQGRLMAAEKIMPSLLQIPGISPKKIGEFLLRELDENIEIDEFMEEGAPSIVAQNAGAMPNLAQAAGNPMQAAQGGANAAAPKQSGSKVQNIGGMAA